MNTIFIGMKPKKNIALIVFSFMVLSLNATDKLTKLRTDRKIITENSVSEPYYTIQIVALRETAGNAEFFMNVERVREFVCNDGYVRYSVGEYYSFANAAQDLDQIKSLGYHDAFVLNLRHIALKNNDYIQTTTDRIVVEPGVKYTIQLAAYRFPVYINEFKEFDDVFEFYMKDRIYRYTVGAYDGNIAQAELDRVKRSGYPDAFLVRFDQYEPYRIE